MAVPGTTPRFNLVYLVPGIAHHDITFNGDLDLIDAAIGGGLPWTEVTDASVQMLTKRGYLANRGTLVTLTLPNVAEIGDAIEIAGKGAGGWKIAQNSGQSIHVGKRTTTVGAGGSLSSKHAHESVSLRCLVANTEWEVIGFV